MQVRVGSFRRLRARRPLVGQYLTAVFLKHAVMVQNEPGQDPTRLPITSLHKTNDVSDRELKGMGAAQGHGLVSPQRQREVCIKGRAAAARLWRNRERHLSYTADDTLNGLNCVC